MSRLLVVSGVLHDRRVQFALAVASALVGAMLLGDADALAGRQGG